MHNSVLGSTRLLLGNTRLIHPQQGADWVPMVIVGNKSDLRADQRHVPTEDGRKLAEEFNCSFTEASARLNTNVARAFEMMVAEIEKSQNPNEPTGGAKCCLM